MSVKVGGARSIALLVATSVVFGLIAGGCAPGRAQPTPIYIYQTAAPTPSPSPTPVPTPSPAPTASPTEAASPTVVPSPTARPQVAAVPASSCSGSAGNKAFWAQVAPLMSWDVYCAILPSGWGVSLSPGGGYDQSSGGTLYMSYSGPDGETLRLDEGAFCTTDASACASGTAVGTARFGDLPGSLHTLSGGGFAVYVNPGTATGYALAGSGMSRASFVSLAAALARLAKS